MNMFRTKEKVPAAQTPVVPPSPSQQDLDNPITNSINKQDTATTTSQTQTTGVMGVMQKPSPAVSKAPSSESLEGTGSTQNPGMLRGVMQKVNPFKSTSQSQVSKASSSETLDEGRAADANQNPGVFKGVMQKVNPFKSTTQAPKNDSTIDTEKEPQTKQNPGVLSGMMQKVNPFKSSQPKPLNGDLSCSEGSLTENNNLPDKQMSSGENTRQTPVLPPRPNQHMTTSSECPSQTPGLPPRPNQQNPGMFKGMIQKVNPFKSSSSQVPTGECQTDSTVAKPLSAKTKKAQSIESDTSSSSESLCDETIERHSIWYTDAASAETQSKPEEPQKKRAMNTAASEAQAQTKPQVFGRNLLQKIQ